MSSHLTIHDPMSSLTSLVTSFSSFSHLSFTTTSPSSLTPVSQTASTTFSNCTIPSYTNIFTLARYHPVYWAGP